MQFFNWFNSFHVSWHFDWQGPISWHVEGAARWVDIGLNIATMVISLITIGLIMRNNRKKVGQSHDKTK